MNTPEIQHVLGPIEGYIWPASRIYVDPQPGSEVPPYVDYREIRFPVPDYYQPEYLAEIARETSWVRALQPKPVPADIEEAVGRGTTPCPYCGGSGTASSFHVGATTKMYVRCPVPCTCRVSKLFWGFWANPKNVPARFQGANLDTITPFGSLAVPTEKQAKAIRMAQDYPEDSFLLVGPPNSGKTFLGYALLRRAARKWAKEQVGRGTLDYSIWAVQIPGHLRAVNDWYTHRYDSSEYNPSRPALMPDTIDRMAARGLRPVLLADEMDKFNPSGARLENLQEIVNSMDRHRGQLIGTCNASPEALAGKWGVDEAGTILRRFYLGKGAHLIAYAPSHQSH